MAVDPRCLVTLAINDEAIVPFGAMASHWLSLNGSRFNLFGGGWLLQGWSVRGIQASLHP